MEKINTTNTGFEVITSLGGLAFLLYQFLNFLIEPIAQ